SKNRARRKRQKAKTHSAKKGGPSPTTGYILTLQDDPLKVTFLDCLTGSRKAISRKAETEPVIRLWAFVI
ncbi:MAG TPA: hypothetical protein VI455_07580, partial [Terriglobia bacterium]